MSSGTCTERIRLYKGPGVFLWWFVCMDSGIVFFFLLSLLKKLVGWSVEWEQQGSDGHMDDKGWNRGIGHIPKVNVALSGVIFLYLLFTEGYDNGADVLG